MVLTTAWLLNTIRSESQNKKRKKKIKPPITSKKKSGIHTVYGGCQTDISRAAFSNFYSQNNLTGFIHDAPKAKEISAVPFIKQLSN